MIPTISPACLQFSWDNKLILVPFFPTSICGHTLLWLHIILCPESLQLSDDFFYNGNRNDMLSVASNVSIASDDDQIQAHKWKWVTVLHTMMAFWYRFRRLIQVQVFWYRFRHLLQIQALATDPGILIQIQASWYRFRHSDTDLFFMCYIWYRIMQSNTKTCNLIQNHAICYIDMQSAT